MHKSTVDFSPFSAHLMLCENVDLACLTSVCDAEQLYTDAAFMLDASTRVTTAAGSCLIDVHLHCVVDGALESKVWRQPSTTTRLMLGLARKSTLLDDAARDACAHQGRRVLRSLPHAMM